MGIFQAVRGVRAGREQAASPGRCAGILVVVLAAIVTASVLAPAHAQPQDQVKVPPEVEAVAQKAFAELRSPVTPSHTLDFCPAASAVALRDSIRTSALGGMSADQIVEAVIARHGEQVRLVPKRSGFGLAAWLLTPLALVVGGFLIAMRMRVMRRSGPAPVLAGGAMTDEERTRLDAALREFDRREDDA